MISLKKNSLTSLNFFNNNVNRSIYKKFNLRLFDYNQNIKQYSAKKNSNFQLNKYKNIIYNQNTNVDSPITIEHCTKEKKKNNRNDKLSPVCFNTLLKHEKKNKHKILIFSRSRTKTNYNNCHNYLNMALLPIRNKIKNHQTSKTVHKTICLKNSTNNLKLNINEFNLNKQKKFFATEKYFSDDNIAINKENNPDDDYSDCKSLKGLIINIKQKISENKYKVNKTFNDFDKQILQDQYLIERFYEMKKSFPYKRKINQFRKKQNAKNINEK
jgi:hypothetical protein